MYMCIYRERESFVLKQLGEGSKGAGARYGDLGMRGQCGSCLFVVVKYCAIVVYYVYFVSTCLASRPSGHRCSSALREATCD